MPGSHSDGAAEPSQSELDLLADGRECLERFTTSPRFRYLYPEGPSLAILFEAYQELDRRRIVGRIGRRPRSQIRALRRIVRQLAHHDAIARHRRLRWRYPSPRVRPPHVQPLLVQRALHQVDPDARGLVLARISGDWATPDPGSSLTTEAIRENRGLDQFRDALINESLSRPDRLARLHPQFLLFAASDPPFERRYPIASLLLVKLPLRLVLGVFMLFTLLYLGAFAVFNDERLGDFLSGQISGLVEGELEMGKVRWELPLIVDFVTGQPTHVVVENISVWEPNASYGGERTRRTAWVRRIETEVVVHEIIPWNRIGVPLAFEIPWVLHFTEVRSEDDAWFIIREYDDTDDQGQAHTLLSLLDAFLPVEPADPDRSGLSFRIDQTHLARATIDVDFMRGLVGWRTLAELRDVDFALRFDSPSVEQGTEVRLPLRFSMQGRATQGRFQLDDIDVPFSDFEIEDLASGMNDAALADVTFSAHGQAANSPLVLRGLLADAFTRELDPEHEPLPLDAVVEYGSFARVELAAGSDDPRRLARHIEHQLGLARGTIAAEDATVWARVEGPLDDPRYHLAAEGLALDLMGEPAWTMDDVKLSVAIETGPVPDRFREHFASGTKRLVARFDTFEGSALDGAFALDPSADEGAMVVFPEGDEAYLIAAPLTLDGINPAQLSPDDLELSRTLAGQADGSLDLRRLEIGPPFPDAERQDEDEDEDELQMRVAEIELREITLLRDRGPRDDGIPKRVRADGTILIGADGAIDLDDLVLRTDGTELRTTGGVDGELSTLEETLLRLHIDDGRAFARAFDLDPYFDTLRADLTVFGSTGAPGGGDGNLVLAGVAVQDGTTTQASMWMTRGVLGIHAPRAHLFGGTGSVDAEITLFERGAPASDPKLRATIDLRGVELADVVGAGLSGAADVQLTIGDAEGKALPISRLEIRGRAQVARLRFGGTRYRDAVVEFSLDPEQLSITELVLPVHRAVSPFYAPDLTVPIGKIIAHGTVGLVGDPALDLEVEAEGVPLRLVARLLEVDVPVRGQIGRGTSLAVRGTLRRPSVAGTVALSGLSTNGIALGSGELEVTSQDLEADGPLAAHRELRVEGELRTSGPRDSGVQWTLDAVVALGETRARSRSWGSSELPPLDAEVDVRFDRVSLDTLLRGLARGTGTAPTIMGRLDQLGAHVLTCDPGAAMISDCLDNPHREQSLEVSLQLGQAWVSGREPTTTDPCKDPAVLCTASELVASIDGSKIELQSPWKWRTGGIEPAELTLTGDFDLSDASATATKTADLCRPPSFEARGGPSREPASARAEIHGELDLAVIADLLGSEALGRARGRLDIDLALDGPLADAKLSGRVTLPDEEASESLVLDMGDLGFPVEIADLDLRIDDHWLAAAGQLRVLGEVLDFGTVRGDHTGFAFGGPCEGHWGVAVEGTVGSRIINKLMGEGTASKGNVEIPQLVAGGNLDDPDPLAYATGSLRFGRTSLTLDLDEGLPPVELVAGRLDLAHCADGQCPSEIPTGSLALYIGGEIGARSDQRPSDALRAKLGPRGTAFVWGTAYLAPDYESVEGTRVILELEDLPYRGYDRHGRPVYEAQLSSSAIVFEGGIPLVVSGKVDVDRARYVQDAVQGVEMLRFTEDVDLPSAPPPGIIRDLQFDLRVRTTSPLRVENNVAHGVEADAVVDVAGNYEHPEFTGRVDVEAGGTVDIPFLTGTYEIQRGRLTLLRELADAEVDVLALRRELVYIDNTPRQVYLLLGGTAKAITWQCIAEGDTSGAVESQRGCLDYLVLGAGDVQDSALTVQRTGGGGLANARKPLQVVGHVTEFDFGRRIEEAAPRFGPYVPDIRLRLGQIGPELQVATPEDWLDFDYAHGTAGLDYTRGYPGFLLQQSRELTFKVEAIDLLVFEVSRDIRSYLNNRIIFDPLRQTTVEFRVDFEIPSLR